MSRRNYWTIYDDDSRDWVSERESVEAESDNSFGELIRQHFESIRNKKKGKGTNQPKKIDHFTQDDDLFEV